MGDCPRFVPICPDDVMPGRFLAFTCRRSEFHQIPALFGDDLLTDYVQVGDDRIGRRFIRVRTHHQPSPQPYSLPAAVFRQLRIRLRLL